MCSSSSCGPRPTPPSANNFHQALHAARRVVGAENLILQDEIVVLGGGGGVAIDVDDFEEAAAIAASTGAPEDIRHTLTLWSVSSPRGSL